MFGESACRAFLDNPRTSKAELQKLGDVRKIGFNSEEERNAYIQGLEDAQGWIEVYYEMQKK